MTAAPVARGEDKALDWFAKAIRDSRKKMQVTQRQAATDLNVGYISYFRYEHGLSDPPLFVGLKMCRYFGIDPKLIPMPQGLSTRSKNRKEKAGLTSVSSQVS